jgi:NAD(P)-dependent dehydrogenase (short-subunit alcohol dehydrogenase family)
MEQNIQVRLDGKVAIVTGSSVGWGRGVADELARRGAAVCVNGRHQATVDSAVAEIAQAGGRAIGVVADVSVREDVDRLVATTTEQLGRLDIMINNAATPLVPASIVDQTDETWRAAFAGTVDAVFYGARAAARVFLRQGTGGRIINMAASSGVYGIADGAAIAAAKGGVLAATYSWALELADHGITVNAVRAGVDTPGAAELVNRARAALVAAGRDVPEDARELGVWPPSEAAGLVVWLASDEASDVTGRFIGVDGPKIALWEVASPAHALWHKPYWDVEAISRELPALLRSHRTQPQGIGQMNPAYKYVYGTHETES